MNKARIYGAWVNGTWTELKAYKKINAVRAFQDMDFTIRAINVSKVKNAKLTNSHQVPIEDY